MTQRLRLKIGEDEIEVEGEPTFVEKHVEEFLMRIPKVAEKTREERETTPPKRSVQSVGLEKNYSAAEFYKQKRPDGGTKSLVVLGKFLHDSEHKENFSRADIKALCTEIRIKDIHSQYYTLALKQGWMRETENGFAVTITGDELVNRMTAPPVATGARS